MKKTNYIKRIALIISNAAFVGLLGVTRVSAWGPERTTFTMENPASYPVFNSITNNPTIGDEREFVRIGDIDSDVTNLGSSVEIVPGKQYLVYIYFHNNASSTYNDSAHNYSGIATATRVSVATPHFLAAGEEGKIQATITAANTNPLSVWDDVSITTKSKKISLNYVAGSAKIYNDFATNGTVLSDNLFTQNGTLIGLTSLDGAIPGCEEYHGTITYVFEAKELSGTVDKTVSKDGENFTDQAEINPGEEVTFKLAIKNTGDQALTNATIKDTLPTGLTLVPGSVQRWANSSTTKETISDDIVSNGINLGTIGTGNTVYITFRVKAGNDFDCDGINMTNKAVLTYDSDVATGDSDEDTAKVKIKKDGCDPEPTPEPTPDPEPDCSKTPDAPECKIPETGPVEIVMAVAVALGIAGGAFYLYRTKKSLKTIENTAVGKDAMDAPANDVKAEDDSKPETPKAN